MTHFYHILYMNMTRNIKISFTWKPHHTALKYYSGGTTIKWSWEWEFWQHCCVSWDVPLCWWTTRLFKMLGNNTQQHTKSTQKTGLFHTNTFEVYLLSVNRLTFERLFTWTQVWHMILTAMTVLDQLTWSLTHSPTLTDADVSRTASCQSMYCR